MNITIDGKPLEKVNNLKYLKIPINIIETVGNKSLFGFLK